LLQDNSDKKNYLLQHNAVTVEEATTTIHSAQQQFNVAQFLTKNLKIYITHIEEAKYIMLESSMGLGVKMEAQNSTNTRTVKRNMHQQPSYLNCWSAQQMTKIE